MTDFASAERICGRSQRARATKIGWFGRWIPDLEWDARASVKKLTDRIIDLSTPTATRGTGDGEE
jgi:hypothetical protein